MTDSTTKQMAEELLPFYVNGSLDDKERELVEQVLANDENLRAELDYLQKLYLQVKQQPRENSPGELGLKRLQRTISAENSQKKRAEQDQTLSVQKNRWKMAALAACLVLVVQTVSQIDKQGADTFKTASGPMVAQDGKKILSVTFTPEATEQRIRALLLEEKATIIGGPSALGIYHLQVSGDLKQSAIKLKSHTDLIESVQEE